MEDPSVQGELRPMTGAHEMPLAAVERIRAAEVWTSDGERSQRPLVARQKAAKGRIAGGILLATVGHQERHSRGSVKARRVAVLQVCDRRIQAHPDLSLAALEAVR